MEIIKKEKEVDGGLCAMKTLAIEESVWKELKHLCVDLDCSSMNDLIKILILRSNKYSNSVITKKEVVAQPEATSSIHKIKKENKK